MTEPAARSPDIEIYLKRAENDDIIEWLSTRFTVHGSQPAGESLKLSLEFEGKTLEALIVPGAARGGYSSLWFKENHTPWASDEACAREAFEQLGCEVRCSRDGWTTGQDDEGAWLRFTDKGVSEVNWRT